jgi:hypothetical protein
VSPDVEEFVCYQVANAPIREYPFPHQYVRPVFPEDYHVELLERLRALSGYVPIGETGTLTDPTAYRERLVRSLAELGMEGGPGGRAGEFWRGLSAWLLGLRFRFCIMEKYRRHIVERFGEGSVLETSVDARLVRDLTHYSLGPHTDAPHKLVSLLFYLPPDETCRDLGTSIYAPIDPHFRCAGGPHYGFDKFRRVVTMPYVPNSLFLFFKNDAAFHGVEPIAAASVERNLLLYNIYVNKATPAPQPH